MNRLILACVLFAGFASAGHYVVQDCLVADMDKLAFDVVYRTENDTSKTATLDFIPDKADGKCGESLVLTQGVYTLTMTFKDDNKKAVLTGVTFAYDLSDTKLFPDAVNASAKRNAGATLTYELSEDATFYKCSSLNAVLKDAVFPQESAALKATTVKMQAFNVVNGTYTGDGKLCAEDVTTAAPTTQPETTTPPVTTTPKPENKFVVADENGTVCLVMTTTLFNISIKCDGVQNDYPVVATEATVTGECAKDADVLTVKGIDYWVNMVFTLTSNNYHLTNVTVKSGNCKYDSWDKSADLRAPQTNVYRCNAEKHIGVSENATLIMGGVKMQAFRKDGNSTALTGTEYICMEDSSVSNIVPIAVGCALAGLIVIVLIAYIIGRLRRRPYEPV